MLKAEKFGGHASYRMLAARPPNWLWLLGVPFLLEHTMEERKYKTVL